MTLQQNWQLRFILILLMAAVFCAGGFLMYEVLQPPHSTEALNTPSTTVTPATKEEAAKKEEAANQAAAQRGSLGIFDTIFDSRDRPIYTKVMLAALIMVITIILEIFLIMLYATFFVNDEVNKDLPLGLPQTTVRLFLITIIVLVILIFAPLPDQWGSNKAVVLLFGLLSTVVGFYFGSRTAGDSGPSPAATTVHLTLDGPSKTQQHGSPTHVIGTLDKNFKAILGVPMPSLHVVLLDQTGTPVPNSTLIAVVDDAGKVAFNFDTVFGAVTAVPAVYILHVLSPTSVICEERITVS